MPQSESLPAEPDLHTQVVAKLVKVFGPERGAALLHQLLARLELTSIATTADLTRVAALLQTRPGFEGTAGAMLSVMAAVRGSRLA